MFLLQLVPEVALQSWPSKVKILATNEVWSKSDLKFWRKPHWAVIEQGETLRIKKIRNVSKIDRSLENSYGVKWIFTSTVPGRVIFQFSGISPSSNSRSFPFKEGLERQKSELLPNALARQGDSYVAHGDWGGSEFRLEWSGSSTSDRTSKLNLSFRGKTQCLGHLPGFTGVKPIWFGDLDGDGELDLLVSSEGEKGFGNLILFMGIKSPTHLVTIAFVDVQNGE